MIFIDACYERDAAHWNSGIDGVLILPGVRQRRYFSVELTNEQRVKLGELRKQQIIFETETLAALVALLLWKDCVAADKCILMLDNEAAKFAFVRGFSNNALVDRMVKQFAALESESQISMCFRRVPTHSNIADSPSRGVIDGFKDAIDCNKMASGITNNLLDALASDKADRSAHREKK